MQKGMINMIDGHMHLENGPLTKEYVLSFVEAAKQKGLDEIQILDHTPVSYTHLTLPTIA